MDVEVGNDSPPPRRSVWQRLDTAGKRVMAFVGALGVIVSTAAGVKALLPEHEDRPEERASVAGLRAHVEPLRSFEARERLLASGSRTAPRGGGAVAAASSRLFAAAALLAQTSTQPSTGTSTEPGTETSTEPAPETPGQTGPETSTQPSTVVGTTSVPGTPSGRGVLCVEDTSVSAETPTLTSTTPSTSTKPGSPPCQIVYAIPSADLRKSVSELRRESDALGQQLKETYALSGSCDTQPPPEACPLARGIQPRRVTRTLADRATRAEAAKLALIREELRQLRNTKTVAGPRGKRDALGVRLDYRLRVCGFDGQSLRVFWTLFDGNQPPRIPYYWDSNRLANTVERKSSRCQSLFPSFWVPMPAKAGRFTVALSVYDEDGVRRGPLVESGPFRS